MEQPDLWAIEPERFAQGIQTICGVDEAGAGPLAGRVYAGAVILPKGWTHPWLGDSKKVTGAGHGRGHPQRGQVHLHQ